MTAYDPRTGREIWNAPLPGFTPAARPVFGIGHVFIATGRRPPELWAIRVDGKGDVTDTHVSWKVGDRVAPQEPSPLLVNDLLYVVSNDNGWLGFMQLDETDQSPTVSRHLLQAYDLAADGTVSNRRVVIDYSELYPGQPCSGPDGITSDTDGNLYMAERCEHRPGIAVRNPNGKELAFISTGTEMPTNVGFGRGDESNVLYVTSGNSLYKIQMVKDGYQLP